MATLQRNVEPITKALVDAHNDTRKNAIGSAGAYHYDASEQTVTAANATSLATAITLLNNILNVLEGLTPKGGIYVAVSTLASQWPGHLADVLAHKVADTTNVTGYLGAAVPSALADVQTAANTVKTKLNAHFTQAGVHAVNDAANTITAANATDLASLQTLLNQIKTNLNTHFGASNALSGASLRLQSF